MKMAKTENMKKYEKYTARTKKIDVYEQERREYINNFWNEKFDDAKQKGNDFMMEQTTKNREEDLLNLSNECNAMRKEIAIKLFAPAKEQTEQEKEQQEQEEQEQQEESEEDAEQEESEEDVTDSVHTHEKVELNPDKKEQVEKVAKLLNNLWKKKALSERSGGAEQQTMKIEFTSNDSEPIEAELVDWEVA